MFVVSSAEQIHNKTGFNIVEAGVGHVEEVGDQSEASFCHAEEVSDPFEGVSGSSEEVSDRLV